MTFGEKLKIARTDAGLKQAELAKQLHTTGNTISNWENNVSKPDLDMLAYIFGVLNVKASFFLESKVPEDEISLPEFKIIRKYRNLDDHGKKMVDFTLKEEYERSIAEKKNSNNVVPMTVRESSDYEVNAAHADDYMGAPDELKQLEEDIMDDENF